MYELYLNSVLVGWHKGAIGAHAFDSGQCSASLAGEEGTVIELEYDHEVYRAEAGADARPQAGADGLRTGR